MNVFIILVRPQLEENIGAVARSMMNFGFSDLLLVKPVCDWLGEKSIAVSCNASEILKSAVEFNSVNEAISSLNYTYALSARTRSVSISSIPVYNIIQHEQSSDKIGFVFGPENSGLSNEDISLIDKIVTIQTSCKYKSLNLSQAVTIVCYELSKIKKEDFVVKKRQVAKIGELDFFLTKLEEKLIKKNFFRTNEKMKSSMLNIKNMFKKCYFTSDEIKTFHGIIKNLYYNVDYDK